HEFLAANAISADGAKLLAAIANDFAECVELDRFDPGAMALLSSLGVPRALAEAQALAARGEIINFSKAEELAARHGAKVQRES
ncbi:MAG TPA: hypothetical protein VHB99_19325, partial [Pirellulales bacterium]|nr:hypothetical protein [Pirellulales bacterium]